METALWGRWELLDPSLSCPAAKTAINVFFLWLFVLTYEAAKQRVKMSTTANTDGLEEKGETRVMGLGVGVFLIFFFSMLATVVCLIGATTPRPG